MTNGIYTLTMTLSGKQFGRFEGARVQNALSGAHQTPDQLEAARADLARNMERLIRQGEIVYCEPGQTLELSQLFKANGHPYFGMVVWVDGEMTIERVKIMT